MNVNFFSWIRDGVKHSVLLGVSDAIETLGTPEEPQNMHPSVAALLKTSKPNMASTNSNSGPVRINGEPNRTKKRLGRSLKDIDIKPAS